MLALQICFNKCDGFAKNHQRAQGWTDFLRPQQMYPKKIPGAKARHFDCLRVERF